VTHASTLRALLAAVGILTLAGAAAAAIPEVESPFADPTCREIDGVLGDLRTPTGLYVHAKNCPATCRKAERDCEQYGRLAAGCWRAYSSDVEAYAKQNCMVVYPASDPNRRGCLQLAGGQGKARLDSYTGILSATVQGCQTWEMTCESTCTP
jgi:hypothetical protein